MIRLTGLMKSALFAALSDFSPFASTLRIYLLVICTCVHWGPMFFPSPLQQAVTPGDNSARISIETSKYTQVVIYDHITRRKT